MKENNFTKFFANIFWLNLKRFKNSLFWRLLLVSINYLLFLAAGLGFPANQLYYICAIVALSNILFIYTRIHLESGSIQLLRLFGASKLFIIVDYMIEVLLEVGVAIILFFISLFFIKPAASVLYLMFYQIIILSLTTPIFALFAVSRIEKIKNDL